MKRKIYNDWNVFGRWLIGAIVSVFCFLIVTISYRTNRNKITPTFIFALLWGVITLAESIHLFGLYKSEGITYWVILTGVVSFSIGSYLFRNVAAKGVMTGKSSYYGVRMSSFLILMTITILLLLKPTVQNIRDLLSGTLTMGSIRRSTDNVYSNVVIRLLYNYIALPCSIACLPIVSIMLVMHQNDKEKRIAGIIVATIIFERVFIDAGRGILVYFLVMLLFSYKLYWRGDGLTVNRKKTKKRFFVAFLIAAVSYVMITVARGTPVPDFFEQLYVYFCGCIPFLNSNIQLINQKQEFLLGAGGLHGPLQFVYTMLENVGIARYPFFMQQSDAWYNNALIVRSISPTTEFNAYATAFYNVYLDGGVIAVFIEMLLYGAFARCVYNMTELQPDNQRIKCIYLFVIYGLVFSFIRFQFSLSRNFICFILIILIMREKRVKI